MVEIIAIAFGGLLYATSVFAVGFFLTNRSKRRCGGRYPELYGSNYHGNCGHSTAGWALAALWPVTLVSFAIFRTGYLIVLVPLRTGKWLASTAEHWEWAK